MSDKNDIRIDISGNADGFESAMHDATRELDAAKKQMLEMQEKAKNAGSATHYLSSEIEGLSVKAKLARDALELEAAAKRASQHAAEGAGKASAEMGKSMNVGRVVQNTANQLTDFVVQVNGGTSATIALSQQLPQMLYMFGATGAVIGFVASMLPNLVSAFSSAGGGAKTFSDAMSGLDKAIGDVGETTKTFDMEGLYEQFNNSSEVVRQATIEQLRFQQEYIRTTRLVAEKKFGDSISGIGSYSTLDKLSGAYGGSGAESLSKQLGVSVDVARDLQPMLSGLKRGTEDVSLVFNRFGTVLLGGNAKAVELAATLSTLSKSERDAASASSSLSDAIGRMAKGHVTTKKESEPGKYDQLIKVIREKTAVAALDAQSEGQLTDTQKLAAKAMADLRDGQIKLTVAQKQGLVTSLEEAIATEKLARSKNAQLKADVQLGQFHQEDKTAIARLQREGDLAQMGERQQLVTRALYQVEDVASQRKARIIEQYKDEIEVRDKLLESVDLSIEARKREAEALVGSNYDASRSFDRGWGDAFKSYSDNATNAALTAQGAFQTMTGVIEDSLVGFALNTKLTFKDMAQSILKYLAQVAAKQAAMGLMKLGTSLVSSAFANYSASQTYGTNLGSQQTSMLASQDSAFAGMRASGGPVAANKTYLVGEQGPELLRMGSSGGSVVPNSAIGGSSFTLQQVFNISGDGGGDQSSSGDGAGGFKQFADMMAAVTKQVIVQEMRSGGMLEKARTA